jgi:hypothetical protein
MAMIILKILIMIMIFCITPRVIIYYILIFGGRGHILLLYRNIFKGRRDMDNTNKRKKEKYK